MSKQRPGVMIYFSLRNSLTYLKPEQKGRLFEAILDYGEMGTLPDFGEDIALTIAWGFIQPQVDADAERYAETCEKRKEAAQKRWKNQKPSIPPGVDADASTSIHEDAGDANNNSNLNTIQNQYQFQKQYQSQSQLCRREAAASDPPSGIRLLEEPGTDFENLRKEQMAKLLRGGL